MINKKKNIVILGSTGSIGQQALEVIDWHKDSFKVVGLAAFNETEQLRAQTLKYKPQKIVLGDENKYKEFVDQVPAKTELLTGMSGLCELAAMPEADLVLVALSGAVGILPTLAAIEAEKIIALANKETLVAAGDIVMQQAAEKRIDLIPVDSEHSAIFQCLHGERNHLCKIWLTASGGPFRDFNKAEFANVTVDMALKHPKWNMGPKITIDSATLMNKGLEVIEAHHLFNTKYDDIKVVIHKDSIVHSLIELVDGAYLAHIGIPDMRIPIQYAFTYPLRAKTETNRLDLAAVGSLSFNAPDFERFPCLRLAYEAGRAGGTLPAVLNAANEIAVSAFLNFEIGFDIIPVLNEKVMLAHDVQNFPSLDVILSADKWAREYCRRLIERRVGI